MILADTCIWIDHLEKRDEELISLLNNDLIFIHPFVIGELACGDLKDRDGLLRKLHNLQRIEVVTDDEVLNFIEQWQLMGRGIGYIDAHLLVSTMRSSMTRLWTCDRQLYEVASSLGIAHKPSSSR